MAKKGKKIEIDVSELKDGKNKILSNINGNYVLSDPTTEISENNFKNGIEAASFDFLRNEHLYNKVLQSDSAAYVTTFDELLDLAKNPQNDITKIVKINSIIQYYANKDDIIGKVIEIVENNINTNYSINFPNLPNKKKKVKENLQGIIKNFNKQIDLEELIISNVLYTYLEGNFIMYLRGDANSGYVVETYPLGLLEITDYKIDNEPIVTFDVSSLKQTLQKAQSKFKKLKAKSTINLNQTLEDEILKNYPLEVGDALKVKDNVCFLNPERVGVNRINNFRGLYGLSPVMKSLNAQLLLDTYDTVDRKNAIAKSKKIYHQVLRADLLEANDDGKMKTKFNNEIGYAHGNLLAAMQKNTVILTTPPYVEKIEIIEPQTTETNPENILINRNRVLNALGIGFLSNESKSSFNTVNVNVDELLKIVNKISKRLENIINKFYKVVCIDNGIDEMYSPTITIQSTDYLDSESKAKLIDLLYSKLGASYQTIFKVLGNDFDFETEVRNRIEENEYDVDGIVYNLDREVFVPHATSFNSSGSDDGNEGSNTTNDGSDGVETDDTKNIDVDKQQADKQIYESKKKTKK